MDGAEVAVDFLARNDVRVCFGNPGTTEMNLISALAGHDDVRYVPTLHEGVAVGAADGYFRIAGKPAVSLLHNGIGLSNALTSLFNARRANSAGIVLVGDHSDELQEHRETMSSGVKIAEAAASTGSHTERITSGEHIEDGLADALISTIRAPRGPVVVALPYDIAWSDSESGDRALSPSDTQPDVVDDERVSAVATVLRNGGNVALLLGNDATRTEPAIKAAGRIAQATGCRLLSRPAVLVRGTERVPVEQFVYSPLHSVAQLGNVDHLILVGANPPVIPWGYPSHDSPLLTGAETAVHVLATPSEDVADAVQRLADQLGAPEFEPANPPLPDLATGTATPKAVAQSLAALLPHNAVLLNEGISNGGTFQDATAASRPHTLLTNVGGAIGWAQAAAIGCALADPDRKIVAVQGDGAAMYLPQALWTIAREELNVLIVILANRTYRVLELDLELRGIAGAHELMRIDNPSIDWVSVARGLGIDADTADDMEEFNQKFASGVASTTARMLVVNLAG
jgi:acetolactate synthase-1/2/3 large subunit